MSLKKMKKLILLFSKNVLNWSRSNKKILVSFLLINVFELSVHQRNQKQFIMISTKILRSWTVFNINNTLLMIIIVSWTVNQHIRMISKGSCATEDWSNDAENSALRHRNKLHFKIYSILIILLLYITILTYLLHFWSNKCSLGEHKRLHFW